jgi:agmatinase
MTTKERKIASFNPNDPHSEEATIFNLPFGEKEADLILLPVPWEVTVSYNAGTAGGPAAIYNAAKQVDLYDLIYPDAWKHGIYYKEEDSIIKNHNKKYRQLAENYLRRLSLGKLKKKDFTKTINAINKICFDQKEYVKLATEQYITTGKLVGLIGGDHSTPLGFIEALSLEHKNIGILQIDAHCDLRKAYQGFTYSHASIMYNALQLQSVSKLVQVGVRDFCNEELEFIDKQNDRIKVFFDTDLKRSRYAGDAWHGSCRKIVDELPEKVYISFDIDGLDPKLCPGTGTPVPGGLEFDEAVYLLNMVHDSGRKIVGFDLCEVAPGKDEWDANVGARMLYKLCTILLKNNVKR